MVLGEDHGQPFEPPEVRHRALRQLDFYVEDDGFNPRVLPPVAAFDEARLGGVTLLDDPRYVPRAPDVQVVRADGLARQGEVHHRQGVSRHAARGGW